MLLSGIIINSRRLASRNQLIKYGTIRSFKTSTPILQMRSKGIFARLANSILRVESGSNRVGRFAVGIGQSLASGVAAFSFGGFAHYIFRIGKIDPLNLSELSPDAQKRLKTVYLYFGAAVAMSFFSGAFCFQLLKHNSGLLRLIMDNSFTFIIVSIGSQFILGSILTRIEYTEEFGLKQILYGIQAGIIGFTVAPLVLLGGHSISRAAYIASGLCGGLAILGSNASVETFRGWEGPLSIGTSIVLGAFIGYMIGGRMSPYSHILYWTFMHGGVALFSTMFVYNSNTILHHAKYYPQMDPINESLRIYMDAINIFGRLCFLLPTSGFLNGEGYQTKWNSRMP